MLVLIAEINKVSKDFSFFFYFLQCICIAVTPKYTKAGGKICIYLGERHRKQKAKQRPFVQFYVNNSSKWPSAWRGLVKFFTPRIFLDMTASWTPATKMFLILISVLMVQNLTHSLLIIILLLARIHTHTHTQHVKRQLVRTSCLVSNVCFDKWWTKTKKRKEKKILPQIISLGGDNWDQQTSWLKANLNGFTFLVSTIKINYIH